VFEQDAAALLKITNAQAAGLGVRRLRVCEIVYPSRRGAGRVGRDWIVGCSGVRTAHRHRTISTVFLLAGNGEVLIDHDDGMFRPASPEERKLAYVQAARRYPEQRSIAPERPPSRQSCQSCGGSGEITLKDGRHTVCNTRGGQPSPDCAAQSPAVFLPVSAPRVLPGPCRHAGGCCRRSPAAATSRLTLLRLSPCAVASDATVAPAR
jgi:hypothetical protein